MMNIKRLVLTFIAVFAIIFGYEWFFHGTCLKGFYEQTAELWRGPDECIFWAMMLGQVLFAFMFSYLFARGYEGRGLMEGVRFGIIISFLLIPRDLIFYAVQPLPGRLVMYWIVGGLIESILLGLAAALIYRKE